MKPSSILDIVALINEHLCDVITGWKLYGIAQTVAKDKATLPAENEMYIGIDDIYPAQLYHKINGITIAKQTSGFGDKLNILYTYQMSMIVFLNRNKVNIRPEDLVIMIHGSVPQKLQMKQLVYVNINFLAVNLNDQQVFAQEYKDAGMYKIDLNQHLFQISYSIEILYKPGCFETCVTAEAMKN